MRSHYTDTVPNGVGSSSQSDADAARLQGGTLVLARGVWIAGVIVAVVVFFASIPAYYSSLHVAGPASLGLNGDQQLTPAGLRQLQALGLSTNFYAAYFVVIFTIFVIAWLVVGTLIFWRKADDRMAYFTSFILMIFGINFTVGNMVGTLPAGWWVPVQSVRFIGGMGLAVFFSIFPDGRFVPRWTSWLLIGWVIHELCGDTLLVNAPFNPFIRLPWLDALLFVSLLVSLVVIQVYRYRRVSNAVQRQQTKWVVFGMAVAVLGFAATLVVGTLPTVADTLTGPLLNMIANTAIELFLLLIPISVGFAISRSRLWDIDIIINKTLVYGSLTTILALLYVGLIIGLQSLLGAIIKQSNNDVAIVVSTLAIAALFQPLRRRIQQIIDHRFYRRKYDTQKTLAAFSATLRHEVDLATLSEHLVTVVQETMQPASVSLWLRPPEHSGTHQALWRATPAVPSEDEVRGKK